MIRRALADSGLYRTGLRDDAIVLTFISPRVGERHAEEIERLQRHVGWPLRIHAQPNQNAILDAARRLLREQGWTINKGPSIFAERAEVTVTVLSRPERAAQAAVEESFAAETGYRLTLETASPALATTAPAPEDGRVVQIPVARVRVQTAQLGLALNPAKLNKALARIRRDGFVSPPISVRRLQTDYLLLDGLYRLRAAQTLGHEQIAAEIEN